MSTDQTYPVNPVGRRQKVVVCTETSDLSEAITAWSGGALIRHLNDGVITDTIPDVRADAKRHTLDQIAGDRVAGKHDATFSIEASIRPSGSAGTAPDIGPLLIAAGLTETVDSGVSVIYAPASDYAASVHVLEDLESVSRLIHGGFVESLEVALTGMEPPKATINGRGTKSVRCGYTTMTATEPIAETSIAVAETGAIEVGSWIALGAEDNTGAGYRVTARSTESGAGNLTITPGLAAEVASGSAVGPFCPDLAAAGVLLPVTAGTISVAGSDAPLIEATLRIANTVWDDRNRVSTNRLRARRITSRDVTLDFSLYVERGDAILGRLATGTIALTLTIGDTAGTRLVVYAPRARITTQAPDVEVSESAIVYKATAILEGSSGNDGFELRLT
jgi:hypothetical protein